jgi:hypothetical protein
MYGTVASPRREFIVDKFWLRLRLEVIRLCAVTSKDLARPPATGRYGYRGEQMKDRTDDDSKIPSSGLLLGSEPVGEIRHNRVVVADKRVLADGDTGDDDSTDSDGTDSDGTDNADSDADDSKDADGKD